MELTSKPKKNMAAESLWVTIFGSNFHDQTFVKICALLPALLIWLCRPTSATPLDDYILKPDAHFGWYDTGSRVSGWFPTGRWEGIVLNMTSQSWLSRADVDCTVWTHHLVIVKPGSLKYQYVAFLLIGGGSNTDKAPTAKDELLELAAALAVSTKSVAAVLYQVPNQPCRFTSDGSGRHRYEDDLIAYTWHYFLMHPDSIEWPARLPMTKAAVRAMDAIQEYAYQQLDLQVAKFVVAGASKRGWTTWTTGAVDKRVVGLVPIVMDLLNFVPNLHHSYRSLGGWTFAFEPYYALNITAKLDSSEMAQLMSIVDPYAYRKRLTMPKLIVTASNDEFFLPDDSIFFWKDLEGEKHLLVLSNTEHSLATGLVKLLASVQAFYFSILQSEQLTVIDIDISCLALRLQTSKADRPRYGWFIDREAGNLRVTTHVKPIKASLWSAHSKDSTRRDFRWLTGNTNNCPTFVISGGCFQPILSVRRSISLIVDEATTYSIQLPQEGYGAFFVELWFPGPTALLPFIFTTEVVIVPNDFPYPDCQGLDCKGTLV